MTENIMTERIDVGRTHPFSNRTHEKSLMAVSPASAISEASNAENLDTIADSEGQSPSVPKDVYPGDHGDWRAISCSIGVFFTLFVGFGILNIPGAFQTYWETNQLKQYSQSQVSWIAATQFFLTLFGSVFTGRWFDLHGGRVLFYHLVLMVVMSVAWIDHLSFGILYGQSVYRLLPVLSCIWGINLLDLVDVGPPRIDSEHDVYLIFRSDNSFIPAVGVTAQWYYHHRGLASGVTFAGGSIAGIVLPIAMRHLFTTIGFPWTIRVVGFINLASLIAGNLLIRPRIKPTKTLDAKVIDLSALKDPRFALLGTGIFFSDWALFGPITFITSYALSRGIDPNLSYYMIAFLNVGSSFGRVIPGLLADKIGPYGLGGC
jgi:MFS family permease